MTNNIHLFLLIITVLVSICHQISGQQLGGPFAIPVRYRNPIITKYYSRFCKNTQCGFEAVCERRTYPCLIPTCPTGPGCVQTPGGLIKNGECPHPSLIPEKYSGRRYQCNSDYGCNGSTICCHGYKTSRCMRPRRRANRRRY